MNRNINKQFGRFMGEERNIHNYEEELPTIVEETNKIFMY